MFTNFNFFHSTVIYAPSYYALDVVFLLDSSSAVSPMDFKRQIDFVKRLSLHLGIMQGESRLALISYGEIPDVVLRFNEYKNASEFLTALDMSPIIGGEKRIDRALETATVLSFESRSRGPKAVILFTAEKQIHNRSLEEVTAPLRKLGIWTYVIGIGSESDIRELGIVTVNNEDVFHVKSFSDLLTTIGPVASHVTNTSGKLKQSSNDFFSVRQNIP